MTVRRVLTMSGLLLSSLLLMAFQGEQPAPTTNDMIPALIWILLLGVAVGLLFLAWGQRDVDAFAVEHHDDHAHDGHDHAHDADAHVSHAHADEVVMATPVMAVDTGGDVHAAVMPMEVTPSEPIEVEPMMANAPIADVGATIPDEVTAEVDLPSAEISDIAVADVDTGIQADMLAAPDLPPMEIPEIAEPDVDITSDADVSVEAVALDTPTLPSVQVPDMEADAPVITPMSATFPDAGDDTPDTVMASADLPSLSESEPQVDMPDVEADISTSAIGMRERPRTFPKVDIPDTLPAAEGSVRDTMEFRMGEDNPGEVVQRPYTGETYEPTLMSGSGMDTEPVATPDLDVPDLGMPALDAASNDFNEPDTEAVASIANVSLEAGLYEDEAASETTEADSKPGWFVGTADTPSTPATTTAPAAPEWEATTLEPPNPAEGAKSLPVINLPSYDSDLSGAPKWLVTGEDDEGNDDLQIIEGIGPKIASILNTSGIRSFRRLAGTSVENLREVLDKAGISHIADPSTWAEQAQHAAEGAMDKLQELQERLRGGRKE
jgi:predicted flap endonuclease-1-like 5' DNA nuclease